MNVRAAWRARVDAGAHASPLFGALDALGPSRLRPRLHERRPPATPERRELVSVVIPNYNYARYLREALASVLEQEHVDVEAIVVDDASTDASLGVLEEFAGDPRVVVVALPENVGHVRAFNAGFARATGTYLARLDSDDLLTPGSLARSVALLQRHPEVGLVYGNPRHFHTAEQAVPTPPGRLSWQVWSGREWFEERLDAGVNAITTPEALLRMSVVAQVGPLDTRLRYAQDMEMWLRAAVVADVARISGADQALHREHPVSMSATSGSDVLTDLRERARVFDVVIDSVGDRLPDAQDSLLRARRALAVEILGHLTYARDRGRVHPAEAGLLELLAQLWPGWAALPQTRTWAHPTAWRASAPVRTAAALAELVTDERAYLRWRRRGI